MLYIRATLLEKQLSARKVLRNRFFLHFKKPIICNGLNIFADEKKAFGIALMGSGNRVSQLMV